MDNQTYTYGQSNYIKPKSPPNTWTIPLDVKTNFISEESKDYKPTLLLLNSIEKAREDREAGTASPIFSSVSEMKKWFDEQNE